MRRWRNGVNGKMKKRKLLLVEASSKDKLELPVHAPCLCL